ncbi:MAG: ABC transporter permease [Anaerolineales bacterium]|nr:ABC transporter permease [Anaerolineales bacterium]MCS7248147.1 ABC transporter permease [Anaerolineales bacterium]MDW8161959.1 ABC transporter permease [Anaerolineales bacterium]MDW8447178.1 ABC transporter permease [Anaerolineales bacterium]
MLDQLLSIFANVEFYAAIIRMTTPLLLAAMGSLLAEKAGVVTFSMEGMMLMGAVGGIIGSGVTGNVWMGVLLAILFGISVGLIYAIMAVSVGAHQIVTSVGLNLGALGLSAVLYPLVFKRGEEVIQTVIRVPSMPLLKIPILGDIPFVGNVFFNHLPPVYIGYLLAPVVWFILYRTSWGLKVRAVGEHPHAADTVGISVAKVRYATILFAGACSGLAGAFLSIGLLGSYMENMTAGRGFIAYTAIVFGKWEPTGVLLGTLLFGMADALQLRIQALGIGIPYQFLVMFPYVVTMIALISLVGKASWPASYGSPFRREAG